MREVIDFQVVVVATRSLPDERVSEHELIHFIFIRQPLY